MRKLSLFVLLALVTAGAAQEAPQDSAFLGVHVATINEESRAAFPVPEGVETGVILTHIEKGSAAEKAGLRVGDILTWFDGKDVSDVDSLVALVQAHKPGDKVTYRVLRKTGSIEGTLALGRRVVAKEPGPRPMPGRREREPGRERGDLDRRLDKVARQIEEMHERIRKNRREMGERDESARTLQGFLRREELAMERAKKAGAEKEVRVHLIRLQLLREMREAGVGRPRQDRIEKKLDRILELLQKR